MSSNSCLVPTANLRWFKRAQDLGLGYGKYVPVLQQYWTDPLGVSGKGEWRDVPTETLSTDTPEPPILEN